MYLFCAALMKRVFNSNNAMAMKFQDVLDCKSIYYFLCVRFTSQDRDIVMVQVTAALPAVAVNASMCCEIQKLGGYKKFITLCDLEFSY